MKQEIEPINDTTFEVTLIGGDKVEIGDREATDFKPHLKLNRWGGECFIAVKPANLVEEEIEYEVEEDKVKSKYKVKYEDDTEEEFESEFYPLEPRTVIAKDKDGKHVEFKQNGLGGFEFEIIVKKKPKTNKIALNIETRGLKFYYQPELTPEEIGEGAIRPDNVIGSYAVYHATRTNMHRSKVDAEKYKCGIAFHIYRPKITDAEGKWVWGELSIDEAKGTLTTTIPRDFLDNAVYPVSTGTTNFGFETKGGAKSTKTANYLRLLAAEASEGTGTAVSMTAYLTFAAGSGKIAFALYKSSDRTLKGYTEEWVISYGWDNWKTLNIVSGGTIENTNYDLAWWIGDSSIDLYYNEVTSKYFSISDVYDYPNWLDPHTDTSPTNYKYSIYCTYEEAAPPVRVPRHSGSVGVLMF